MDSPVACRLPSRIPHKIAMEMIPLCNNVEPQRLQYRPLQQGGAVPAALAMARDGVFTSGAEDAEALVTETVLPRGPSEQGAAMRDQRRARQRRCGGGNRRGEREAQAEVSGLVRIQKSSPRTWGTHTPQPK